MQRHTQASNSAKKNADKPCFDPERYEEHKLTVAVLMNRYMLRHFLSLYKEFNGDLLLPVVLGEIGHHNIMKFYSQEGGCLKARNNAPTGAERLSQLEPSNAYSISEATGIPRETVRRKIDKLVKKGWLTKGVRGEVAITELVTEHFTKDFNKQMLAELLMTSKCITDLLHTD